MLGNCLSIVAFLAGTAGIMRLAMCGSGEAAGDHCHRSAIQKRCLGRGPNAEGERTYTDDVHCACE